MKKSLIILCTISFIVGTSALILGYVNMNSIQDGPVAEITPDVLIPLKVSRPGCEKTDTCYIPSSIKISQGSDVIWVNNDGAFHSVTSGIYENPLNLFDSGYLDPGESFTFNFTNSGIFEYFCTLHPWMDGVVIVEPN